MPGIANLPTVHTAAIEQITNPLDPRVAAFQRLNDTGFRKQLEAPGSFHHGLLVGEGWLVLERLIGSRYPIRSVLVDDARVQRIRDLIDETNRPIGAPVYSAPRSVLDEIVGFPLHRGVVAVAERGRPQLSSHVIGRARRLVLLEGVNDAENLGAICRNAAGLGCDGLLLDSTTADPLSRRSVRVSMGHALALPHARHRWPDGLADLTDAGFRTIALSPSTDSIDIADISIGPDDRIALLAGAEGPGISAEALSNCTDRVRIPMARGVDSLNVATALAIAAHRLFELPT